MWQLPPMTVNNILMYLRKSRTDDPMLTVEEVLQKHEQMLCDWVEHTFPGSGGVPESNRFREVVSGETIDARPRVQDLLHQVESPRYKAVLVVEPQRLSRGDLEDIGRLVKLLRYSGTLVITLQYIYDLSDERDRDLFERELKRGNEFLEYQKRIMGNGRLLSVQNGNFIGQTAPYGYRKTILREGKRKCHTLEPDPITAPIVQEIFRLYVEGVRPAQIAAQLNARGIPAARGARWTVASVKPILLNDHYIGMVHWNRRKTVKVVEDGEVVATRPRSHDYLSYPGRHPAIIDQATWEIVQARYGSQLPIKARAKHANPYAGMVFCQCGARMNYRTYTKGGVVCCQPRVLCVEQSKCNTPSCLASEFTEEVIKALREVVADFDIKLSQPQDDTAAQQQRTIDQLLHRLEELDRQEYQQWDKYTQEQMPRHIFEKLHDKLLSDRASTQAALAEARSQVPPAIDYAQKRQTFLSTIASLQSDTATVKEQNQLLKQCIVSITYSRSPRPSGNPRQGPPAPIRLSFQFQI